MARVRSFALKRLQLQFKPSSWPELKAQKAGQLAEAAKDYADVARLDPRFAGAYMNLGLVRTQQSKPELAIPAFKKAIVFQQRWVGRGLAVGDINNDGKVDVVISTNNGAAHFLINQTPTSNHWLSIKLRGVGSNRGGIGSSTWLAFRKRTLRSANTSNLIRAQTTQFLYLAIAGFVKTNPEIP